MESMKSQIHSISRMFMRPIASLLLRCGMTWKEFAELCKTVFVDVASEDFGIKGRKTNISRVSLLTGLSRKEVRRVRNLLESEAPPLPRKTTDATRVLSGWHQDPEFVDANGTPIELPMDGLQDSFKALMKRYGGDIPPTAMAKELLAAESMIKTGSGTYRAISRYYMPTELNTELLEIAGSALQDLATTVQHNLTRDANTISRFRGSATNETIDRKAIPEFKEFMEKEGQAFLEKMDDWLSSHQETQADNADSEPVRLGAGLFAIENPIER